MVDRELTNFKPFCETASAFWSTNVLPAGERVILVEGMTQDLRVTLRNLTVANALRRMEPARVIVYSGADDDWNTVAWTHFDLGEITELAQAYGAEAVVDLHTLVDERIAGTAQPQVVGGVDLAGDLPQADLDPDDFDRLVYATACRVVRAARLDQSQEHRDKLAEVTARSVEFARLYEALVANNDVVALVTSHVDYNNFGLAVEVALRHDVPVLFTQATGNLKAYAIWPERVEPGRPVRAVLTEEVGEFFEQHVWPHRDVLARGSELTTYRAKATLGRPSWWRAGRGFSTVDLHGPEERTVIRTYAARRTGLDPTKPTVSVFNHAVSDALGTNVEAFGDLGEWFERTAEHAVEHPEANWLFLDHPHQRNYDVEGFFDRCAERWGGHDHLKFMRSMDLSKNFLTALTDLVVTVRGSVSNEYTVLGIPALQCGWSEWSKLGFTTVTESPEEYFEVLDDQVQALLEGRPLITPEQVQRARLWAWFYRSGADVPSGLVQHWAVGENDQLFDLVSINMLQSECDADAAFTAVRRLWQRRDPLLTRIDWHRDSAAVADMIAPVGPLGETAAAVGS